MLVFAKAALKNLILIYFDSILLVQYIFIFWHKNPGSVQDEFWCNYLTAWSCCLAFIFTLVRKILNNHHFFTLFVCSNQMIDRNSITTINGTSLLEVISFVLLIVIKSRITFHNLKDNNNVKVRKLSKHFQTKLMGINISQDQTLACNLTMIGAYVGALLYAMLFNHLDSIQPTDLNEFPNYVSVCVYFLNAPIFILILICLVVYLRNPSLRKCFLTDYLDCYRNIF